MYTECYFNVYFFGSGGTNIQKFPHITRSNECHSFDFVSYPYGCLILQTSLSGLIVGVFPSVTKGEHWPRFYSIIGKLFALSFGLCLYGGMLGILLFGDPTSMMWLIGGGLLLGTGTLIGAGVKMFFEK